jgi:hypothetical protein
MVTGRPLHDVEELEIQILKHSRQAEEPAAKERRDDRPRSRPVMLGILVFTICIGFPVAFTLMALGVAFGFYAYFQTTRPSSTTESSTC